MSYADTSGPPMRNATASSPAPTRSKTRLLFLGWATFGGSCGRRREWLWADSRRRRRQAQDRMRILNAAVTRLGRTASLAVLLAAWYGAALIVGGFLAPVYESMNASSSGVVMRRDGPPRRRQRAGRRDRPWRALVMTLAVGWGLWHGSRRGAIPLAWALTGLLGMLNVLATLSIGVFVLPVTAALTVACATRRPR